MHSPLPKTADAVIDRKRLGELTSAELELYRKRGPRSAERYQRAQDVLLSGVPMSWMVRWSGPFPLFVASAEGARFTDVDGRHYVDFCLGDTGAMAGHSPPAAIGPCQGCPRTRDHALTRSGNMRHRSPSTASCRSRSARPTPRA